MKLFVIFIAINLKVVGVIQIIFQLNTYNFHSQQFNIQEFFIMLTHGFPLYLFLFGLVLIVFVYYFPNPRQKKNLYK
ncbi:hypothetical protein PY093_08965 [Cytobacillus sp. S13-E01]|uniref:hypothetical protein n=1 Tax=Cytobacillus sp. S13-E01 TaxID=3031326 RepID=UPI0023D7BBD0|nr:hypothetical protein [Cytobacillus sp. S13-E01]MDF0726844.1 hypothetical protein [Cytobacillus sp. S13-E01]